MTEQPQTPPLGLGQDGLFYEYDGALLNQWTYPGGEVLQSWPFATEEEAAAYVAERSSEAQQHQRQMLDFMAAARAGNNLFLDKPNNTIILIDVVRQVKDLTKQNNRMMRLLSNDLDGVD